MATCSPNVFPSHFAAASADVISASLLMVELASPLPRRCEGNSFEASVSDPADFQKRTRNPTRVKSTTLSSDATHSKTTLETSASFSKSKSAP
jgi:hypothetical protein